MSLDNALPSYINPPVIEVVYGVAFSPLAEFYAPHSGLFWSKVRHEFPTVRHAPPLGPLPPELDFGSLPLPRIWFISKDENFLIQLQNNRFLFNWRVVRPGDKYPRFERIQESFDKYFAMFREFVIAESLGELSLQSYELTYINHIDRAGRLRGFQNLGQLFPDLRWRSSAKRFLPTPSHLAWQVGFELPGQNGRLVADLKPAQRKFDMHELLVLELKASGPARADADGELSTWFDLAREWIVRGFSDLTSEKMQKELWGRENLNV